MPVLSAAVLAAGMKVRVVAARAGLHRRVVVAGPALRPPGERLPTRDLHGPFRRAAGERLRLTPGAEPAGVAAAVLDPVDAPRLTGPLRFMNDARHTRMVADPRAALVRHFQTIREAHVPENAMDMGSRRGDSNPGPAAYKSRPGGIHPSPDAPETACPSRSPGSGGDTPGTGSAADSAALSPVDGGREAAWSAAWLAHWREPISEHERRALRVIAGGRVTRDELARRMSSPGLDITPTGAERVLHRLEAAGLVECDRVWWCHTGHAFACRPDETCGGEA